MLLARDHTLRTSAPPSSLWPQTFSGSQLDLSDHQNALEITIIIP